MLKSMCAFLCGRGLGGTRLRGNKVKGEGGRGRDKIKGGGTRLREGGGGNKIKGGGTRLRVRGTSIPTPVLLRISMCTTMLPYCPTRGIAIINLLYDFRITTRMGNNEHLYRHGQYGEILPSN